LDYDIFKIKICDNYVTINAPCFEKPHDDLDTK